MIRLLIFTLLITLSCTKNAIDPKTHRVIELKDSTGSTLQTIVYNESDQIIKVNFGPHGSNASLDYDEQKLIKVRFWNQMVSEGIDYNLIYDNDVLIRVEVTSCGVCPPSKSKSFYYNESLQIEMVMDSIKFFDGELIVNITEFEYDNKEDLIKAIMKNELGEIIEETIYEHDNHNNPFYKKYFHFDGNEIQFSFITSPNNITRISITKSDSSMVETKINYEYDSFHFPTKANDIDFIYE